MSKIKHVKPTQEELDANIKKTITELETMEEKDPEEEVESEEKPESEEETNEETEEEKDTEEESESESEEKSTPKKKTQEKIDYEKKFKASSRESQLYRYKNQAFDKASNVPEPTEEELKKDNSDWDDLNDFEQKMAKDNLWNKKRFEEISKISQKFKNLADWRDKVDEFIDDPQTLIDSPGLEGKTEKFKSFASKKERRGTTFDILVSAFLYDADTAKKKHKGKMFPTGTGGANTKPSKKPGKISIDEGAKLKKVNYSEYRERLKAGKIENEI